MMTTTSAGITSRSTPLMTWRGPKYLCRPFTLIMGSVIFLPPLAARHVGLQLALEELEDDGQYPIEGGSDDKGFQRSEILAAHLLRPVARLPDGHDRYQGR